MVRTTRSSSRAKDSPAAKAAPTKKPTTAKVQKKKAQKKPPDDEVETANKIVKAVEKKATVVVNAEKPGRGNFVVKVNGTAIVELLGLKRPFPPLKALDMEEVVSNVLGAIGETD